jgi:hypothetical protein
MRAPLLFVKLVVGSVTVYVAMAACGGASHVAFDIIPDASPPTADAAHRGDARGVLDALTDPIDEAQAAPPPLDVAVEPCDKTANGVTYAEHTYAGRTMAELSAVHAVSHSTTSTILVPGYSSYVSGPAYVRDGAVAVVCYSGATASIDTVTFVFQP